MKQVVLVTGGAGYIGSHACKALYQEGFTPVSFDNLSQGHKEAVKWGPLFEGDLLNPEDIKAAFEKYQPIAVMHFAASAIVVESMQNPSSYYRNNIIGTLNVLDACKTYGVSHFIFSSTCATYGIPETSQITEWTPQKPINPYGKSKRMIEEILEDYDSTHGLKYLSLRYFNAAGADLSSEIGEKHHPETHLIPLLIDAGVNEKTFTVYGNDFPTKDGFAVRDFIHVTDLARAHVMALQFVRKYNRSESLNLGSGVGFSVLETIECLEKILEKKISVTIAKKRRGEPPHLVASVEKARKLLHWTPEHSDLYVILKSALDWYQTKDMAKL